MPQVSALMAAGMPASWANMLGTAPAQTVTAAGSTQQTATQLVAGASTIGTGAAGGVILPPVLANPDAVIMNNSGNAQNVYPAVGESLNSLSPNTAISIPAGKSASFKPSGHKSWIVVVSA